MSRAYILVVDDEPDIRNLVKEILQDESYEVAIAEDGKSARQALRDRKPELILLDIWMPDVDGITLLKEWGEDEGLPCPVIMMSGHGTVETAVEATRLGAYDFLEKPLSLTKLLLTVDRALEAEQLKQENVGLKRHVHAVHEPTGRSPVMQRLREQVKRIALHDTWVLVTGEPGSGRETLARYLHSQSVRRDRPFVEANVRAIVKGNAAQELFGSEIDGRIHYGRLEQAVGSTLFLDEVADMGLEAQSQLVGALDTGCFLRVGGTEPVSIDVRIIAATQHMLEEAVQEETFREDLFYHLNVVPLHVPPLREHAEDVPELLNFYIDWYVNHEKLPYRHFTVGAQNTLRNHPWLGNVRELKNLVQRLLILGAGNEISQEEVDAALGSPDMGSALGGLESLVSFNQPLRQAREEFEKVYLEYQLRQHGGNISRMAKEIGMERTHLYRKLKFLEIGFKDKR
ncbi:MAG: sigma-54 dependent transcriptional regulator [Candidatus Thiodiazotropha sp. (ex Lucinoma aequizonata)]|nr:sigma-54 dependent transcriptional regulator [Candidatus Thiodiazotropha sp. (ex Lucinoma aequizonata)]MCU7888648.1 sigma-54 dependent transcriptional regulator [Candidatus Thiodiazotropha sp. (ex Lucinoma aequizonata)]MCU7896969.1 sigma-54 dependent transcriptional regulator [Candidatus Thiodiazotropha sp. (ex Lucinoma aequizonata)]MCU7899085.1 sigma-54 dependent transcriptional regulator [Candidatus Thiodiazotropha sp. (ex Lucinoma aequizonata)]MCU7902276.1 sigma-54 dependent transcription